jgi:hypothetical protein
MTDGKDTAWKFYGLLIGVGLAGLAAGTFLLGPVVSKKLAAKKKKSGDKKTETTSKKTT